MLTEPPTTSRFQLAASGGLVRLRRAYFTVPFALSVIASFSIVLMMLLICADIGLRFLFNAPIPGVNEIVSMFIVVCVFLQLGSTVADGRMIRADFVMRYWRRNRPALARAVDAFFFTLAGLMLIVALRWLWRDFISSYETSEFVGAVGAYQIGTWPFKLGIVIGCAVALIECLRVAAGTLAELRWNKLEAGDSTFSLRRDLVPTVTLFSAIALLLLAGTAYDWTPVQIGGLMLAMLLASVAIGMPIAFALLCLSFLGIWLIRDNLLVAESSLGTTFSSAIASYEFAVVPLFVIMGLVLEKADVGRDAFHVCSALLRKIPGALGIATVAGNAIFGSVTASSIVSASVFSRIAVPPMVENGYTKRFSVGVVAGSSVLGILIPPSIPLIIYGLIAEASIGKLFIAGIVPGILLAIAYSLLNIGLAIFSPRFVGTPNEPEAVRISLGMIAMNLLPFVAVVGVVMGGIYTGVFTPTEAGAVGALAAFAVGAVRRKLTFAVITDLVRETAYITAAILFLIITASYYGRMLTLSTIPFQMTSAISHLDVGMWQFLLLFLMIAILLGMVLDGISILLIMVPLVLPVVVAVGGDLIWFGIVAIMAVEIGLLTPPFGLAVFVVKGSLPPEFVSLGDIFIGAAPFCLVMILVTLLIMSIPSISLMLL
jgi:tripartite ATP-independent transporter DctM subunit